MRLFVQIGKIADEIGEQFDVTRLVLVNAEGIPPCTNISQTPKIPPPPRPSPETFTGFAGLSA